MTSRLGAGVLLMVLASAEASGGCKRATSETSEATGRADAAGAELPNALDGVSPDHVVVYYFHGNRRCRTCMGIQRGITTTIDERFGAETASGALRFREINIDRPENTRFVNEFQLSFSSMIVAARKGDKTLRWQNCERIWPLAGDPARLADYAEEQIRSYLELLGRT